MPDDLNDLLAEMRGRAALDSHFRERLDPIVDLLIAHVGDRTALELAVGTAGLALHVDDKRHGRWPL